MAASRSWPSQRVDHAAEERERTGGPVAHDEQVRAIDQQLHRLANRRAWAKDVARDKLTNKAHTVGCVVRRGTGLVFARQLPFL